MIVQCSAPNISRISLLRLQLLHKGLCLLVVHSAVILTDVQDDVPHVLRETETELIKRIDQFSYY